MIPQFPNFKNLEITDRIEVENLTTEHPPYSDFNFTSLWIWNARNTTKISLLNENLVVKFSDYLTDEVFYSFLGINNVEDTVEKLLDLSKKENIKGGLRFIPEDSIKNLKSEKFLVEEDRDQFDYILDNESLIEYKGRALHNHAGFKRRFTEVHSTYLNTKILDLYKSEHYHHVTSLHDLWKKNKNLQDKEASSILEETALTRIFDMGKNSDNFSLLVLFHNDQIIGFTIDELLAGEFSVRHFMKADTNFKGVYSYLISESSKVLNELGKKYTNIEQDLGLLNLRQAKKSFNPASYLKKYRVQWI